MKNITGKSKQKLPIIDEIGITSDTLSSRGGLSLLVRYLRNMCIAPRLESFFGSMRKNRKGQPITEIIKQLFCNFVDGTSRHLTHFDILKEDAGYAGTIESSQENLLSSQLSNDSLKHSHGIGYGCFADFCRNCLSGV